MKTRALVAALALGFLLSAQARATLTYSILDLGTLGGDESRGQAVNVHGEVVGIARDVSGASCAAYWNNAPPAQSMGTLGVSFSQALAINDDGWATGAASSPTSANRVFLWERGSGEMTDLGFNGLGRDINNDGAIVGQWYSSSTRAFLWTPGTWTPGTGPPPGPVALPTEAGTIESQATGINDSGAIAGWTYGSGYTTAVQWRKAESGYEAAPSDFEDLGGTLTQAFDISADGSMVGWARLPDGNTYHACFWQGTGEVLDLGTFGGTWGEAFALNSGHRVVGTATNALGSFRAFVWEGSGSLVDLNTLIDPSTPGWMLEGAYDISDTGQIVGYGQFGGQRHAFLANPVGATVPEPASCALLAVAIGGIGAMLGKRRRK